MPSAAKLKTLGSRAVLRRMKFGTNAKCPHPECDKPFQFFPRAHLEYVICNVYKRGKWDHVEYWHPKCYNDERPYGPADRSNIMGVRSKDLTPDKQLVSRKPRPTKKGAAQLRLPFSF
jgi:hypothetical protein